MWTGFTDSNGKKAIGVCLDDLKPHLTKPPVIIRNATKSSGFGWHNIAKDFVPLESNDPVIRRGLNSHSRKCTIIWLDCLPTELQDQLLKGI